MLAERLTPNIVSTDGLMLRYFTAGEDRAGSAPVVLVHGLGGSTAADFSFVMPVLARNRFVVSVDLAEPILAEGQPLSLERLVRQLRAVVGRLGTGREIALVGHSLGAVVSAAFAAETPDAPNLVLSAGWARPSERLRLYSRILHQLRDSGSAATADFRLYSEYSERHLAARTAEDRAALASRLRPTRFSLLQTELAARADITESLPRIRSTTLVIGCTDDGLATEQRSRELFAGITDARYTSVQSGHALLAERPAELVSLVEAFLDDPRAQDAGTVLPAARP